MNTSFRTSHSDNALNEFLKPEVVVFLVWIYFFYTHSFTHFQLNRKKNMNKNDYKHCLYWTISSTTHHIDLYIEQN